MKKITALFCTLSLVVLMLSGCGKVDTSNVNVAALKGPTAMGMVKMMEDGNYSFTIAASADEVTPGLIQGTIDIAAVPANLASVLYNKTEGNIKVLAVNTLGVLYIVEKGNTINSVSDLKGKTIYASGKGATPEYALDYMLSENGIDKDTDVTIEYKSEHAECVSALVADPNGVAMLPQPFVTTAMLSDDSIRIALDMNAEWENIKKNNGSDATLITGVIVARTDFVENNKKAVDQFLKEYSESVEFTNTNPSDASTLIENYGIIKAAVAFKAIPYCNITFIAGQDMKSRLSAYLKELEKQNPAAVGGAVPNEDFYYDYK